MAPTDVKFPLSPSGEIISYNYSIDYSPMKGIDIFGEFVKSCQKKQIKTGFYYTVVSNTWLNVDRGLVSLYFFSNDFSLSYFISRFKIVHYNQVKLILRKKLMIILYYNN
jgi:hypothetical protein